MDIEKSQGNYATEQMQQMATVASTANGLNIEGDNFKVNALTGCPDMVLFACERIKELEQELIHTQMVISETQDLLGEVSCLLRTLVVLQKLMSLKLSTNVQRQAIKFVIQTYLNLHLNSGVKVYDL